MSGSPHSQEVLTALFESLDSLDLDRFHRVFDPVIHARAHDAHGSVLHRVVDIASTWRDELSESDARRLTITCRRLLEHGADPNERTVWERWLPLEHPRLTDSMRRLMRAHGARTRDEHDDDWAAKRALTRPYPWRRLLPAELCEHILDFAFRSDRFYDDLGSIDRVVWAERRGILEQRGVWINLTADSYTRRPETYEHTFI